MTTTANVLGVFAHVDTTLQAIRELRAKGFSELTVYTPVPVEEIEEEIEKVEPLRKVRLFTRDRRPDGDRDRLLPDDLDVAQVGAGHGRQGAGVHPALRHHRLRADHPVRGPRDPLALLILGRLPKLKPSPTYDPRFTVDRFGVAVACPPETVDSVRSLLSAAGAEEVRR